jgi:thiosulfate/3-mercaptopyruvate sulfurtransferase
MKITIAMAAFLLALTLGPAFAQSGSAPTIPQSALIQPAALADSLKSGAKPAILQVGFAKLYAQAHIPGAAYAGPGNKEDGLQNLNAQVQTLAKDKPLMIYCGCCPWVHCPNVAAAYRQLVALGFTQVKVLYIENNFGQDWADKGYPVERE